MISLLQIVVLCVPYVKNNGSRLFRSLFLSPTDGSLDGIYGGWCVASEMRIRETSLSRNGSPPLQAM
jgi:hypothetical protein